MLIKLRCSPVSENMPISYGTQAITVQSLGRLAHQGSKSSSKLQETHVFSRVFEDSVAITVHGTNTDVPAHRRLETACPTGRYVVVYLAILAVPHMSVLPPSFLKLTCVGFYSVNYREEYGVFWCLFHWGWRKTVCGLSLTDGLAGSEVLWELLS